MIAKLTAALLLLTLLLPSIAIAQSLPVPVRQPASGLSAALIAKAERTTFKLNVDEGYCTVSPITKDGYLLTALHCVRSCLEMSAAAESGANDSIGLFDLFTSPRSKTMGPNGINCANLSIPALGIKSVRVVETGPALTRFDPTFISLYPDLFHEMQSAGFDLRANDYAILKIQSAHDLACLPISASEPAPGTPIWALGYPTTNDNKIEPVLSASPGRVYAAAQESVAYQSATSADEQAFVVSQFGHPGVVFSNAPIQPGQSGGPVIAADGSVVAVVSGYAPSAGSVAAHELVAPKMVSVLRAMTPALAATLLQKSAACR